VLASSVFVNFESGLCTCVGAVSSVKGKELPNPNFVAVANNRSQPRFTPTCAKIAFTENVNAFLKGYVPVPCGTLLQEIGNPSITICPGHVTVVSGAITLFSSADTAVTVLNVEPGGYFPCVARFNSG
jgi:hypothetical protein